MIERFGLRVVLEQSGLVTSDYDVAEVGVTACGAQDIMGVRVRPEKQIVLSFFLQ